VNIDPVAAPTPCSIDHTRPPRPHRRLRSRDRARSGETGRGVGARSAEGGPAGDAGDAEARVLRALRATGVDRGWPTRARLAGGLEFFRQRSSRCSIALGIEAKMLVRRERSAVVVATFESFITSLEEAGARARGGQGQKARIAGQCGSLRGLDRDPGERLLAARVVMGQAVASWWLVVRPAWRVAARKSSPPSSQSGSHSNTYHSTGASPTSAGTSRAPTATRPNSMRPVAP
jgi:hypothetical protein